MKHIYKYLFVIATIFITGNSFAQTSRIEGYVRDSIGNGIEGVSVVVQEINTTTLTDSKGAYVFKNIPAGTYTLVANLVGYSATSEKIVLKENEILEINLQLKGRVNELGTVTVKGVVSVNGMGHMADVHDGIIYAGKKNEVLTLDSMDANTAQDNPRQVLGRVPGSNYSETEGEGFPSNGIGFRGLNPTQSIETNTREDGYNITGDIYGYPESYYLPPLEAVERVEVTLGASALEFGPQFGGVVNYVVKSAPTDKVFQFTTEETGGSYGFLNSFNSVGGTYKKWSYYVLLEGNYSSGWRPNSQVKELTGFARLEYKVSNKFNVGIEYSMLRNELHMPGGLTDDEFNQNADQSFRARNWLTTPWNIIALTSEYRITNMTYLTLKSALNLSGRSIVWRNEDGGPGSADSINPATGLNTPREVEHEYFKNSTTELRLLSNYSIGNRNQVLGMGVRFFYGLMTRLEGGLGNTSS
ncbi:MAG TPA: carboxypeptidase-like regulatory domain-containing protein, partial [Bacteroidia bacterium]|nr:carboxypeptidase-like regulatory domain-containing protein [Bacteroidia bacterium]